MAVTIKDIAKKANVSIATVSRVMNKKHEGIRPDTRERILKIIEETNYQPNTIAQSMVTNKTSTIGLIIPDIRNPFFPELVRGVEDYSKKYHYNVFLCNTDGDIQKEKEYLDLLTKKKVDGIIYANTYATLDNEIEKLLSKSNIPVVLIDRWEEKSSYSGVFVDNENAGYMATNHLLSLSHKKIGCITGPAYIKNSQDRLNGYKKALKEVGIEVEDKFIQTGNYQIEGGYKAAVTLLNQGEVTAIFALNDLMAFGVYQLANETGVSIPEDLSIVGFDNIKYNNILHPKLTTVKQPIYNMGETSTNMLIEKIENSDKQTQEMIYLKTELIERDSCKKI